MGLAYQAMFFYGILVERATIRQLVSEAAKEYRADKEDTEEEAGEGEGEEYNWHHLEEGIRFIDEKWDKAGDPIAIGSNRYFDREEEYFLFIKETYHESEWNASLEDVDFEMQVDIDQWNGLLEETCKKYDIVWTKPAFQILIGGSG